MDYKLEYKKWLANVKDEELLSELICMNESTIEDSFYREPLERL